MSSQECVCITPYGDSEWAASHGVLIEGLVSSERLIIRLPDPVEVENFAKQAATNLHLPVYRVIPGQKPELVQM